MRSKFPTKHEIDFEDNEAEIIQKALRADVNRRELDEKTRRSLATKVGKHNSRIHWSWELEVMEDAITNVVEWGACESESAEEWRTVANALDETIEKRKEMVNAPTFEP